MADFVVGAVYSPTINSLYKCVAVDATNATFVDLTETKNPLTVPKEQTSAWVGPMTIVNPDPNFEFDSIARDYYSGACYVTLGNYADATNTLRLLLVRPIDGVAPLAVTPVDNMLPCVNVGVVLPWPQWNGQVAVPVTTIGDVADGK